MANQLPFYPVPLRKIYQDGEWMTLHPNGMVQRHGGCSTGPSPSWRITGAVELTNAGHVRRCFSLADILTDPNSIPWLWKNAKARAHLCDFDHGTSRMWGHPAHRVY